jgi:hypothetical protein
MRNRRFTSPLVLIPALTGLFVLVVFWATPVFSNALMLLMDRANFIPRESSIWTFEPYEINQGSSNYWRYGADTQRYYYFAYTREAPYRSIAKRNQCVGFDKRDVRTWCTP